MFERPWSQAGRRQAVEGLLADRRFEFPVERAIFLVVLHRLFGSGSDRASIDGRRDLRREGIEGLDLHHADRALAGVGEPPLPEEQGGAAPFAPRRSQDRVEEILFHPGRDLFSEQREAKSADDGSWLFEGLSVGRYLIQGGMDPGGCCWVRPEPCDHGQAGPAKEIRVILSPGAETRPEPKSPGPTVATWGVAPLRTCPSRAATCVSSRQGPRRTGRPCCEPHEKNWRAVDGETVAPDLFLDGGVP